MHGLPATDHIGRTLDEVIPRIAPKIKPFYRQVIETGEPVLNLEVRGDARGPDDAERIWWVSYAPLTDGDGRVRGVNAVVSEITSHKRALNDLRMFEQIVSASPDHISFVDSNYVYRAVSDSYLVAHNRPRDQIVGRPVAELLGEKTFRKIVKPNMDRCLCGQDVRYQDWFTFPALGRRFMDVVYTRIVSDEGRAAGVIVSVRDLSEQKGAEETRQALEVQLRHAQKMQAVGQLAAGVAHDVNSLLMVILGNAQLVQSNLKRGGESEGRAAAAIEQIVHAVERGKSLVQKLLAFGRANVWKPQLVDLNAIVADTQQMLKRLIGDDIRIKVSAAGDLKRCQADAGLIEQVVMNLLLNARDAISGEGTITIKTANVDRVKENTGAHGKVEPGPHVVLSVSDTGAGMDEATLERAFEPFFSTKPPDKGSGLGLAIVYGIIEQAGGYITVRSKPGEGTTFRLYFPAVE